VSICGQIVVLTGAGSGIGRALAIGLTKKGAIVIGLGRHAASLSETSGAIGSDRFSTYVVDVADPKAVTTMVQRVIGQFGRIDVLFNCAAVYPKLGFLDQDAGSWMETLAINIGGVANCCRAVLPHMIRQRAGRIVNVGSFADRTPIPCSSAYAASKGALHALTKAMAADLRDSCPEIVFVEWIPGHINTQMSDHTGMDPSACVDWALNAVVAPRRLSNAMMFVQDREHAPALSRGSRIKAKLMFWRR
jgi:NAD(P)-dependent dehydrogenase (short-subunit alcohol dehydrogenase family)